MGPNYVYNATVKRVVDGDTLDLFVDLGFRVWVKVRVRLFGINTPETYGVKRDSEEYAKGKAATEFVVEWLGLKPDPITGLVPGNGEVVIRSHDGKALGTGKHGRWIAEVYRPGVDTPSVDDILNESLVLHGHAERVEY